jgi:hypothetical protein
MNITHYSFSLATASILLNLRSSPLLVYLIYYRAFADLGLTYNPSYFDGKGKKTERFEKMATQQSIAKRERALLQAELSRDGFRSPSPDGGAGPSGAGGGGAGGGGRGGARGAGTYDVEMKNIQRTGSVALMAAERGFNNRVSGRRRL